MVGLSVKKCSISGCERVLSCKGFCNTHYERQRLTGDIREKEEINSRFFPYIV